jgi:hypothetical protein
MASSLLFATVELAPVFSAERQLAPDRCVVRRLVGAARLAVDAGRLQPVGRLRRQQQVIDAQAFVAEQPAW